MNRQRTASFALALLGTLFFLSGASPMARAAAAINTFYTFNPNVPPYTDGIEPTGIVSASDGNFYGVTFQGGLYSYGTFYRMNPAGVETVLYTFYISGNTNGSAYPVGLVQGADGNFYGTTMAGGAYGIGTVYKITPAGVFPVWDVFGGHVEPEEETEQALVRELKEELGIKPTQAAPFALLQDPSSEPYEAHEYRIYLVTEWAGVPRNRQPEEHAEIGWFSLREAAELDLAHPGYRDLFLRLSATVRADLETQGQHTHAGEAFPSPAAL